MPCVPYCEQRLTYDRCFVPRTDRSRSRLTMACYDSTKQVLALAWGVHELAQRASSRGSLGPGVTPSQIDILIPKFYIPTPQTGYSISICLYDRAIHRPRRWRARGTSAPSVAVVVRSMRPLQPTASLHAARIVIAANVARSTWCAARRFRPGVPFLYRGRDGIRRQMRWDARGRRLKCGNVVGSERDEAGRIGR